MNNKPVPTNQETREVNYLNRDFATFREQLINFTKAYFPETFKDFNESSPGMLLMEHVSYIGDVLGFYTDTQLKESLGPYANEPKSIYRIARMFGYTPRQVTPAHVELDVFMTVNANTVSPYNPILSQCIVLSSGVRISNGTVSFTTTEKIDFTDESKRDVTVLTTDENDIPLTYAVRTTVLARSGSLKQITLPTTKKPYLKLTLPDTNIVEVVDVEDSTGRHWTEVPFLGQDLVFVDNHNTEANNEYGVYKDETSYLLSLKREPKRFVTRVSDTGQIEIVFGSGEGIKQDVEILPQMNAYLTDIPEFFDINNFLRTKAYGILPDGDVTITYYTSNGVSDNVNANTIQTIQSDLEEFFEIGDIDQLDTIAINNPEAATGGTDKEDIESVRNNTIAFYSAQNRAVTQGDYEIMCLSMPQRYGSVVKARVLENRIFKRTFDIDRDTFTNNSTSNPFDVNIFVLGKINGNVLGNVNKATKRNLQIFLNQKRMITDAVNIYDAFIVNIKVSFKVVSYKNFNKNKVLFDCLHVLKKYFHIDKWQINQPININSIFSLLNSVDGVQNVKYVNITNVTQEPYSKFEYDIDGNIVDNILYPSLDPMIFEAKFPDNDIHGEVV